MKLSTKKKIRIFLAILVVGLVIIPIGACSENIPTIGIGLLIAVLSFGYRIIAVRCTYCGWWLGKLYNGTCPHCHKELE